VGFQQYRWSIRFLLDIYRLQFDQGSMNFPITDTFELGKLLLCCFNRPFITGSRSNNDRALAAPKKSLVSRDFVDKANAVGIFAPPIRLENTDYCSAGVRRNDLNQFRRTRHRPQN